MAASNSERAALVAGSPPPPPPPSPPAAWRATAAGVALAGFTAAQSLLVELSKRDNLREARPRRARAVAHVANEAI